MIKGRNKRSENKKENKCKRKLREIDRLEKKKVKNISKKKKIRINGRSTCLKNPRRNQIRVKRNS